MSQHAPLPATVAELQTLVLEQQADPAEGVAVGLHARDVAEGGIEQIE